MQLQSHHLSGNLPGKLSKNLKGYRPNRTAKLLFDCIPNSIRADLVQEFMSQPGNSDTPPEFLPAMQCLTVTGGYESRLCQELQMIGNQAEVVLARVPLEVEVLIAAGLFCLKIEEKLADQVHVPFHCASTITARPDSRQKQ